MEVSVSLTLYKMNQARTNALVVAVCLLAIAYLQLWTSLRWDHRVHSALANHRGPLHNTFESETSGRYPSSDRSPSKIAEKRSWNCVRVSGRILLYQYSPGVKSALSSKLWESTAASASDCRDPDVIVFTPGQLLAENENVLDLLNFLLDNRASVRDKYLLDNRASARDKVYIAVDSSQECGGIGHSEAMKVKLRNFVRSASLQNTRDITSVMVGACALCEPYQREFNAYWIMMMKRQPFEKPKDPPKDRFLCLGGWQRPHKVYMLSLLHSRGLLKELAWSAGFPPRDGISQLLEQARKYEADPDQVKSFLEELPRVIDIDIGEKKQVGGTFHPDIYSLGKIHFVLETDYLPSRLRYTEKTIKAIYTGKPFLIFAAPGVLKLLKSHGFRSFHPHINETYDTITSFGARTRAIADEMASLLTLSSDDFDKKIAALSEVARYNQVWLNSTKFLSQVLQQSHYAFGLGNSPGFDWRDRESQINQSDASNCQHLL